VQAQRRLTPLAEHSIINGACNRVQGAGGIRYEHGVISAAPNRSSTQDGYGPEGGRMNRPAI
jgi:hypothetical protein